MVQVFATDSLTLIEERSFGFEVNGACALGTGDETTIVISSSDGSLQVVSAATLEVVRSLTPTIGTSRLPPLHDLSCEPDTVWAVVGSSGVLIGLDPETGEVGSVADLSRLTPAGTSATDVLSGIAYRPDTETWFITGGRWDVLYEISLR
jgi:glutamine cyclotransferase